MANCQVFPPLGMACPGLAQRSVTNAFFPETPLGEFRTNARREASGS
jgi:hypothetical protein